MVNIKNFDPSLLEKSKLSCKSANINIFFILNIGTMKSLDYANINSENPLYLIFNNVDWHTEQSNGSKYLIFASTKKNKQVLEKYTELWNETKNQIETINGDEPINIKNISRKLGLNQMMIFLWVKY